ncbi:MAG TPA: pitrilysin family protein [Bryobacteraceae bacterium]|nr:pitrilysin family protein [Bryobacteraceae bacterium]
MKLTILLLLSSSLLPLHAAGELNIPFEKYKLSNGLRVLLSADNAAPVIAVYVIYGVGARSEEKGRTGFAHLFEHMMFQGSANAPKGVHFQTVESNGGTLNGSTHPDYTDYFEVLPSNKLAVALWLESDRMRSLAITKEALANQKEAVKQERRLSFDNQPYATAIVDVFPTLAFKNWSSSHSIIGSFEDLNAAGVEDVAKFFKTYYAPNNAVLALVGDLKIPEAKKLIETYFADIPAQPQPKPPDLTEPVQTAQRWLTHKDPLARVPIVAIGYPGPKRRSPDYYALTMLDILFTTGESSRLYLSLVKEKQSALGIEATLGWPFAQPSDYKDPGIYGLNITFNPSFTAKQVVEQLQTEINKLQTTPVDTKELERARATLRSFRIRGLQSTMNRAQLLAQYELLDGAPELINTEIDQYLAVTPRQVQAAARKFLSQDKQSVLEVVPAPAKEEKK